MAKGRPPALLPDQHGEFASLCLAGLSDAELAVRYRMSVDSVRNYRDSLAPETSKRLKRRGAAASTDSPEVPPENTVVKSACEGDAQSTQEKAS